MKNIIFLLFFFFTIGIGVSFTSQAQGMEYNILGGKGLFHYVTKNAKEPYYSAINLSSRSEAGNYANNPYGNKNGQSFQLAFELKKVTRRKLIWGSFIEYESVESKKKINWVFGPSSYDFREATGNFSLKNNFLVISPYIGYRFQFSKFYCDVMCGTDISNGISKVHQQGSATISSSGELVQVNKSSKAESYDLFETRARLQTEFAYKKVGLYLGYSWGFYKGHLAAFGGTPLYSFSRYFKVGILYRLK